MLSLIYLISFSFQTPNHKILFDLGPNKLFAENALKMNVDIKSDVLKVGHHGSTYASSTEFINKVHPEYAFISCAKITSTGHPHKKALERIAMRCKNILQSRNDGTILFITDGINIEYKTHIGE